MRNLCCFSYFIRGLVLLGLCVYQLGCSAKGNSDQPAPEWDLTPSAPTSLSISGAASESQSPTLTWTSSAAAAGSIEAHWVAIATSPDQEDILPFTAVTSGMSFSAPATLLKGTNYYFIVYGIDTEGRRSAKTVSDPWTPGLELFNGAYRPPESPQALPTCGDYLTNYYYDGEGNGDYWIDLDGAGGDPPFKVSCDQTTAGGGWHLIMNYVHQGTTNPAPVILTDSLPLRSSASLGQDGSLAPPTWGHASNAMVNAIGASEARFFCTSSLHGKVIHFRTSHGPSINYISSGLGRMLGLPANHTTFPNHTASLPGSALSFGRDYGDNALIRFPFMVSGTEHWSAGFGGRWECDDFAFSADHDTIHRAWVR